jgi:hypothetical protein
MAFTNLLNIILRLKLVLAHLLYKKLQDFPEVRFIVRSFLRQFTNSNIWMAFTKLLKIILQLKLVLAYLRYNKVSETPNSRLIARSF